MPTKTRAPSKLDTDRIIREVMAGRHDGRLTEIGQAINERLFTDQVRAGWSFDIGSFMRGEPRVVRDDALSWEEAYTIESLTGESWLTLIDPRKKIGVARACAIAIGKTEGYDPTAVMERMSERGSSMAVLDYFATYELTPEDEAADPLVPAS